MKTFRQYLSTAMGLAAWAIVGLVMSQFVSTRAATSIGFIAFCVVAMLIYPHEKCNKRRQ